MADNAVPTPVPPVLDKPARVSFFGFGSVERLDFEDGQWIDTAVMNEGDRRKYQAKTTKDMRVANDGEAKFSLSPGEDRAELLKVAIKDWDLVDDKGNAVPCNRGNIERLLNTGNPAMIDMIDDHVRLTNPWLITERNVEEIDREIARLEEQRAVALEREEGKDS